MKRVKIKRFQIIPVAWTTGLIMGCLGLVAGIIGSFVNGFHYGLMAPARAASVLGFGVFDILLLPLAGFISGFVLGGCTAYLYNLVAGWLGGIEVEVSENVSVNQ